CRRVGATPYLCVNTGTATAEEAAAWVEYCNGAPETPGGKLRAQDGFPEPFDVRLWGIGNETAYTHEIGATNAFEYAATFNAFAAAMRAVDPRIELVAAGVIETRASELADAP